MEISRSTICPTCNSSDLRKLSLVHATGLYDLAEELEDFF
jgi:hypothetical protein